MNAADPVKCCFLLAVLVLWLSLVSGYLLFAGAVRRLSSKSAFSLLASPSSPFQGQILANLKAMDSDWFAQNYMGRKSKVRQSGRFYP